MDYVLDNIEDLCRRVGALEDKMRAAEICPVSGKNMKYLSQEQCRKRPGHEGRHTWEGH